MLGGSYSWRLVLTYFDELKTRCEKIRYYFLGKAFGVPSVEFFDYGREIGITIKYDPVSFVAKFPSDLSDDEIIAEMEKILDGEDTKFVVKPERLAS